MNRTDKSILAVCYPALVQEEWFYDYNSVLGLDPNKITTSNGKTAFWKCPTCSSIYLMAVKKRLECTERNMTSCFTCRGMVQLHPFTM